MTEEEKKLEVKEQMEEKTENKVEEKKVEPKKEEVKKEDSIDKSKADSDKATDDLKNNKPAEKKVESQASDIKEKKDEKKKKKEEPKIPKKDEAVAKGSNLRMSKRHGMYICSFIKNKKIDSAISDLEQVKKLKIAVPFKGEIPHRKGKGMMSGRYPVKGAGLFISLLKGLKGNVIVNGMDLEKSRIHFASASWGARPARSGRRRGKRTNIVMKAKEFGK